jgi:hypothetical protein
MNKVISKDEADIADFMDKEVDLGESTQNETMPEAKSSVTYTLVSKDGFSLMFTVRSTDEAELLDELADLESAFSTRGYTGANRTYTPKQTALPVDTGEKCPKCSSPLVKFETKTGKGGTQCSTRVYDGATKTTTGCDYIKWDDTPSSTGGTTGGLATPAQARLLTSKGRYQDGMTKAEASKIISEIMGK